MTPSSSTNIETERLQLRPFVRGDLDDLTALNSDKEVMKYISSTKTVIKPVAKKVRTAARDLVDSLPSPQTP